MTAGLVSPQQHISKVLEAIVHSLVDHPNDVTIEQERVDPDGLTIIHIQVGHESDAGKLIGKQGRTARSIRTIISAASMKYKLRFAIDIVEDKSPSMRRSG